MSLIFERLLQEKEWQADSEAPACPGCHAKFGALCRRSHCRVCGKVYCTKCITEVSAAIRVVGLRTLKTKVCGTCVNLGKEAYNQHRNAVASAGASGCNDASAEFALATERDLALMPNDSIAIGFSASEREVHAATTEHGQDIAPKEENNKSDSAGSTGEREEEGEQGQREATAVAGSTAPLVSHHSPAAASGPAREQQPQSESKPRTDLQHHQAVAPPTSSDFVVFCSDCGRIEASCRCDRPPQAPSSSAAVAMHSHDPGCQQPASEALCSSDGDKPGTAVTETGSSSSGFVAETVNAADVPAEVSAAAEATAQPEAHQRAESQPEPSHASDMEAGACAGTTSGASSAATFVSITAALGRALDDGETVVYSSSSTKTRYFRTQSRVLVLTDLPRLMYLSSDTMSVKGSLYLRSEKFAVELVNPAAIRITYKGKDYPFDVEEGTAAAWVERIKKLM
jgi:hypothetical protein